MRELLLSKQNFPNNVKHDEICTLQLDTILFHIGGPKTPRYRVVCHENILSTQCLCCYT